MSRKIEIENGITVGALAEKISLPATKLISELFKNGIPVTINEKIDFDTAQIIVDELGLDIQLTVPKIKTRSMSISAQKKGKMASRPPVVAVMGHVDHGKTSLLDAVRGEDVASSEAGGITQHISAYQVKHNNRLITFLDTPGHEAFAYLRQHGAILTDVVIIVIAADDGVKPQTLEAIRFAKNAGSKMVIAITKIDKPEANIERVKQQLAEQKMLPEEWGGDTIVVCVSSKSKEGIDKLLDMILLVADIEDLKAEEEVPGEGLIVESRMKQGRGATAIALVQTGNIQLGDFIVAGTVYGKVKTLRSDSNEPIEQAGPSSPVLISGFKALPKIGDFFKVVGSEKQAKAVVKENKISSGNSGTGDMTSSELLRIISQKTNLRELNLVIKADMQGSLTSVTDSLKALNTEEVACKIVGSGIGSINENDVRLAATSGAMIYGFQVTLPNKVRQLSGREKVRIKLYLIIYELLDDVKKHLCDLLEPEMVVTDIGRLLVRAIFKTTKNEIICGGEVTKGRLATPSFANIYRENKVIAEGLRVSNLKSGPTDVKEVQSGEMCGLSLETESRLDIKEGDRIEFYTKEKHQRSL